jgi:hypothetical protein
MRLLHPRNVEAAIGRLYVMLFKGAVVKSQKWETATQFLIILRCFKRGASEGDI